MEQGGQVKVVGQCVGQSEAGEREAAHVMHAERRDDQTKEDDNKEKSVPLSEDYYIDRYNTVAEIATKQMCSQHFVSQETLAKLEEYYPSYRNGLIKRLEKVTNLTESDRQAILKKNHIERAKFVPSKELSSWTQRQYANYYGYDYIDEATFELHDPTVHDIDAEPKKANRVASSGYVNVGVVQNVKTGQGVVSIPPTLGSCVEPEVATIEDVDSIQELWKSCNLKNEENIKPVQTVHVKISPRTKTSPRTEPSISDGREPEEPNPEVSSDEEINVEDVPAEEVDHIKEVPDVQENVVPRQVDGCLLSEVRQVANVMGQVLDTISVDEGPCVLPDLRLELSEQHFKDEYKKIDSVANDKSFKIDFEDDLQFKLPDEDVNKMEKHFKIGSNVRMEEFVAMIFSNLKMKILPLKLVLKREKTIPQPNLFSRK